MINRDKFKEKLVKLFKLTQTPLYDGDQNYYYEELCKEDWELLMLAFRSLYRTKGEKPTLGNILSHLEKVRQERRLSQEENIKQKRPECTPEEEQNISKLIEETYKKLNWRTK